jgi:hypothetical protein
MSSSNKNKSPAKMFAFRIEFCIEVRLILLSLFDPEDGDATLLRNDGKC